MNDKLIEWADIALKQCAELERLINDCRSTLATARANEEATMALIYAAVADMAEMLLRASDGK